ncbi:MAG TPA: hypothetical protein VKT71_01675 [Candidatus Acidoferrales bacterium]|nr:hypothetical protein [Candidatus Acidoferrales bacterium]
MFRLHYLGGAEYQVARKHLGITELTWADWGEDIRGRVGRELMRAGLFPPSRYFQEATERPSDGRSSARAMGSAEFVAGVVVE